ncbi:hypothetical protein [Microvirga sp. KLBC 81]|uniref:hypothetical protein n=1 Tax=Microvirga sp. KLBC 81 TaxID=1862707 RepID=UPI0010577484|nr:hypothetical protein [Microvirga sp. KLBC 81]
MPLKRAKPSDTTKEPDFYSGPRYVGGKEGAWGNSDFLYTTLEENNHKYFKNPADYWWYEPGFWNSSSSSGIRYAQPIIPDFHYF